MTSTAQTSLEPLVLGRDDVGLVAESDGMRYYLTDCCLASAKGCDGYVGCRACYQEIDPELGGIPDKVWGRKDDGGFGFVPVPLALTEVFGDGIPHSVYKTTHHRAA